MKKRRIDYTVGSGSIGLNNDNNEDLHSRETMSRLFASNILLSGIQGLGLEIAKNIILAGVKSLTLHDENLVDLSDSKNSALASIQKLQELNNAVAVSTLTGKLSKEQLSDFQAVVFVDISIEKATEFDDYCHSHDPPIAFIKADVRGLFGSLFCDFGPHFTVIDVDGEEPLSGIIASISNGNPTYVSCVDDESLEFEYGDLVVFSEVEGMTELNDGKPRKIKNGKPRIRTNIKPYSFTLEEDTSNYGQYLKGGIVTEVKQPEVLNFKTLREALKDPGDSLLSGFSNSDLPPVLHLAFQALDKFSSQACRFPIAGSEEDAQKLVEIATDINESLGDARLDDVNSKLLRHFAFGSRAVLNPMAAMFGGIVGQEVVKACSGKFHPVFQFFYFDSVESLPKDTLDASEFRPQNSRYDAQISVFGSTFQKKLEDARVFVVGAGPLGCEFFKNLALMGVSCGSQGKLTVTDGDVIAATAAVGINPRLNIHALQNCVGPETQNVFDDGFWENLTVVVNPLDNVTARLYVESRCAYFMKPLLESGTLDAKWNRLMVILHLTENYGASRDPPDKQALLSAVHCATSTAMAAGFVCLELLSKVLEESEDVEEVNGYKKIRLIGQGTYGSVYKAINSRTGEIRALKVLKKNMFMKPPEIKILEKIQMIDHHPNIIQLLDVVDYQSFFFEYMDCDLAKRLSSEEPIPSTQIKDLMRQLLSGLAHLHNNKIIHRDIKCDNILLNNKGILKIADFGMSRSLDDDEVDEVEYVTDDTGTVNASELANTTKRLDDMFAFRTPSILIMPNKPPEVLLGSIEYDYSVDIWAAGCIFVQILDKGLQIFPCKDKDKRNQLGRIFELCGTPDTEVFEHLPNFGEYKETFEVASQRSLREKYKHLDREALDLIDLMLVVDPSQRITAESALSRFFPLLEEDAAKSD